MTELDKVALSIYQALEDAEGITEVETELHEGHHVTNIEIDPDEIHGIVDGLCITWG